MTTEDKDQGKKPDLRPDVENDANWECCRLHIPSTQISFVSSILEAYDNQFLVRTEDRLDARIVVWYEKGNHALMEEVVLDLQEKFPVRILSFSKGMEGLDEVYPE